MRRAIATPLLVVLGGFASAGCGGEGDGQLADADVQGRCPAQMVPGKSATFTVRVENTGEEDWPAAFVQWDGLRSVFMDKVTDGAGNAGEYRGGESYRFGKLPSGATQTYELTVTPTPSGAGKPGVTFAAWGDEPDAEPIPTASDIRIYECDG